MRIEVNDQFIDFLCSFKSFQKYSVPNLIDAI